MDANSIMMCASIARVRKESLQFLLNKFMRLPVIKYFLTHINYIEINLSIIKQSIQRISINLKKHVT